MFYIFTNLCRVWPKSRELYSHICVFVQSNEMAGIPQVT